MTYYAKTNTADPRIGFISTGEILTDAQVDALGKDKLKELVDRGVLGVSGGGEKPESKQTTLPNESKDNEPEGEPEEAEEDEEVEEAEAEYDLPTLEVEDVIADEVSAKSATKRRGRKAK